MIAANLNQHRIWNSIISL